MSCRAPLSPIPLFLALFAAAVGAPATTSVVAAQSANAELVLVRRDAFLYVSPSAQAEKVRDPWGTRHRERLGPFFVMRFVAERGGVVEVATLPDFRAVDHCYPTVSGLEGLDLHLFVRRDAIAPVLPNRVERQTNEEGSIVLTGGVGLTPRGGRRYDAHVRGATLRVELDPAEVGTRYRVSSRIAVARGATGMLAPGARVDLGRNLRLTAEAGRRAPARPSGVVDFSVSETRAEPSDGPPRALLMVEPVSERAGRMLAFVRNECMEVRGTVARRDVTNERPPRGVRGFRDRHGTALRPGTTLYLADGSVAGRATIDAALDGTVHTENGRACFDHPLRPGTGGRRASPDDVLTLCIDHTTLAASRAPRR